VEPQALHPAPQAGRTGGPVVQEHHRAVHPAVAHGLHGCVGITQRKGMHMGLQGMPGCQTEEILAVLAREVGHGPEHTFALGLVQHGACDR
jgi:hypothetical protein